MATANTLGELETKLDEIFVKKAPKLPGGGKKFLVEWVPIISLVLGVLGLLSALEIWRWAHAVDVYQNLASSYGVNISSSRLGVAIWLLLIDLIVESVLYLRAYSGLKARSKQGWNYLYYGALINVVYAVISLFSNYGGVSSFVGSLIGCAIGFYLLFQIREYYTGPKLSSTAGHTAEPTDSKIEK